MDLTRRMEVDHFRCGIHFYHGEVASPVYVAEVENVGDRQLIHAEVTLELVGNNLGERAISLCTLETVVHAVRGNCECWENEHQSQRLPFYPDESGVKSDEMTWEIPCERYAQRVGLEIENVLSQSTGNYFL